MPYDVGCIGGTIVVHLLEVILLAANAEVAQPIGLVTPAVRADENRIALIRSPETAQTSRRSIKGSRL